MAQSIPEMYGSLVFNDKVMRSKLPKDIRLLRNVRQKQGHFVHAYSHKG